MRAIWNIVTIIALLHSLLFAGVLGWTIGTGRIDRDRFDELIALFEVPVEVARAREEQAAKEEAAAAAEAAHEASIDESNLGAEHRLAHLHKLEELLEQKRERDRVELQRMRDLLSDERLRYEKERDKLQKEREAFEAEIKRRRELVRDEQFQKVLETFAGLPSEEQKLILLDYLNRGEQVLALDILNNLPKRTAQNLLKEFEAEAEVNVAADLLMQLIDHGA